MNIRNSKSTNTLTHYGKNNLKQFYNVIDNEHGGIPTGKDSFSKIKTNTPKTPITPVKSSSHSINWEGTFGKPNSQVENKLDNPLMQKYIFNKVTIKEHDGSKETLIGIKASQYEHMLEVIAKNGVAKIKNNGTTHFNVYG